MTTNPRSLAYNEEKQMLVCEICIEWTPFEKLYVDGSGNRWDICSDCGGKEN